MRSKISKKILNETSQDVKDMVNDYANKLVLSGVSNSKAISKEDRRKIENVFFRYERPYYIRIKDGYRFTGEEMDLAINYYIKKGIEPQRIFANVLVYGVQRLERRNFELKTK